VGSWVGRHLLEPRAGTPLHVSPPLGRRAGAVEALDQVVADLLELGHVRDVALGTKQRMRGLTGLAGIAGIGGELRLEARDLAAKLPPSEPLVGLDIGNLGARNVNVVGGLCDRLGARARRVDRPRQVTGVDPVLASLLNGVRCQPFQIGRSRRIVGDEGPEAVARGDQTLILEPAIDRAGRIHVHAGTAGELPYTG
jgi:hypothetical protein